MANKKSSSSSSSSNKKTTGAKTEQWVVIMMGFPGSGKSTVSKQLETKGYVRINQDDLGSCDECKKVLAKQLKHGKSVCIDRCNIHPKERKMWVTEVRALLDDKSFKNIDLIWVSTSVEECKKRAKERKNHPTLDAANSDQVIDEFAKGFKPPEKYEGPYVNMFNVSDTASAKQAIDVLAARNISK